MLNLTFCLFAESFYLHNSSNQALYILQVLLAFICLFLFITICIKLYFETQFEISTKLVLNGICFSIFLIAIGAIIPALFFLQTVYIQSKNYICSWVDFTAKDCAIFYTCYNLGQMIFLFSPAFLALERLISELKYTGKCFGFLLFILQLGIPITTFIYLYPSEMSQDHFPHCSINSQMFFRTKFLFNILISIQLFSLFIYTSLLYNRNNYYTNEKIISGHVSTTIKNKKNKVFQQWRIWDDTELTLPIIIVTTICFLSTVFVEYSFIVALEPYIRFLNFSYVEDGDLFEAARWNEIQILCSILFLIFMGMFLYSKINFDAVANAKQRLIEKKLLQIKTQNNNKQ
uniref:G_PROTEIN_RECEP_F1_2 domain-containing protein n=1 Tax=Parastrongyloides trichosuri TaxID=131310 RepID=A0A0N4ZTG4_PARTI